MAEYGKAQYQPKAREPINGNKAVVFISSLMVIVKHLKGGLGLHSLIILGLIAVFSITIVDSFTENGKVRCFEKRKGMKIYDKNEEPFFYWSSVISSWIFGLGFFSCIFWTLVSDSTL